MPVGLLELLPESLYRLFGQLAAHLAAEPVILFQRERVEVCHFNLHVWMQPAEIESRRLRIFAFAGPADRLDRCSGDFGARLHRLEDGDQYARVAEQQHLLRMPE